MGITFTDRTDAGQALAARLAPYGRARPLVLALPRGGVPVAVEVAAALGADLDVLVVRKLGRPGKPEFAIGAIGEGGTRVIDADLCTRLGITQDEIDIIAADEETELARRIAVYRPGRDRIDVAGRNVVIVDDGLATGATAAAAVGVLRHLGAEHITVASPVGAAQAMAWLRTLADDVVCVEAPDPLWSVGEHFADFAQVSDAEVLAALNHGHMTTVPHVPPATRHATMAPPDGVDLYWIPLGAGEPLPVTRWSGRIFECASARREGRAPAPLFHAALLAFVEGVRVAIEMAPAWGNRPGDRGVVRTGPVGLRLLGRSRYFRYEVRRWREGTIPDLRYAVGGATRVADGTDAASRVLRLVADVPDATWGRDEQRTGDMWNSNSLAAWLLQRAGVDAAAFAPPRGGRAPGWRAGVVVARRWPAVDAF